MAIEHLYGDNVHISDSAWLRSLLARIGSPETPVQEIPDLVRAAYRHMIPEILGREFPIVQGRAVTRMAATEPKGYYSGPLLGSDTKLAIVAVIRAGILPAMTCYEEANRVLPIANVRLDFMNMSRTTDEEGRVTGVQFDGSKIGGPVNDTIVLIADPMGATGGTIARTIEIYQNLDGGPPPKIIAAHMMVTPEAVQRLTASHPDLRIYAGRFDRGMSSDEVLATIPGTHKDRERGLNATHYIVPGAGGIGELLTNSWV
jgi:uracil phosphoribosyltransferase